MRRGVVLHLFAGGEVERADRLLWLLSDAVTTAVLGERAVREHDALARELFVHADKVSAARSKQSSYRCVVGFCELCAHNGRHIRAAHVQYVFDGAARDAEGASNGSWPHALVTKDEDRGAGFMIGEHYEFPFEQRTDSASEAAVTRVRARPMRGPPSGASWL